MTYAYLTQSLQKFFDDIAPKRDYWIQKNKYYYNELLKLHKWIIPQNVSVLDIGSGTGDLLHAVSKSTGEGIDFSYEMIKIAKAKYPALNFKLMDAQRFEYTKTFDYIILSNLVGYVSDVWQVFRELQKVSHKDSRIVVTNYNYLWQPVLAIAEKLHLKMPDRIQSWLPQEFIEHFLYLNGFETVKKGKYLHLPINIPFISSWLNPLLANFPIVDKLGLIEYIVARPSSSVAKNTIGFTVSIIVPTYKEAGNIETIISTMPKIGKNTELIFVDLPSSDGTSEKIKSEIKKYKGELKISYIKQTKKTGKIGAIRLGVSKARGEIILIYDADATIPASDLEKFYLALSENRADFVNGTRLVYPTEIGAMRFVNHLGNTFFARLLTYAFGQHFTDTLCGTKGFWKKDFLSFEETKTTFDKMDLFGDFYLLLSAFRKNLKIAEVPVRYKTRKYGDTKMNRLRNGLRFMMHFILFYWNYKILRRNI